jgi:hypothetical protein
MPTIKSTRGAKGRAKPAGGFGSYGKPSKTMPQQHGGVPRGLPTGMDCYPTGRALGAFDVKVPKSQRKP